MGHGNTQWILQLDIKLVTVIEPHLTNEDIQKISDIVDYLKSEFTNANIEHSKHNYIDYDETIAASNEEDKNILSKMIWTSHNNKSFTIKKLTLDYSKITDIRLSGPNKGPGIEVQAKFDYIITHKYDIPILNNFDSTYNNNKGIVSYYPLAKVEKPYIIQTYLDLGKQDLLDMTCTCRVSYTTPCNECWSCDEKNWGLSIINT